MLQFFVFVFILFDLFFLEAYTKAENKSFHTKNHRRRQLTVSLVAATHVSIETATGVVKAQADGIFVKTRFHIKTEKVAPV